MKMIYLELQLMSLAMSYRAFSTAVSAFHPNSLSDGGGTVILNEGCRSFGS